MNLSRHNLIRRIVRHACDARVALAERRLASLAPQNVIRYVAAVELGLPKHAVARGKTSVKRVREQCKAVEDWRDNPLIDAAISGLAELAA